MASGALERTRALFEVVAAFVREQRENAPPGEYTVQLRVLSGQPHPPGLGRGRSRLGQPARLDRRRCEEPLVGYSRHRGLRGAETWRARGARLRTWPPPCAGWTRRASNWTRSSQSPTRRWCTGSRCQTTAAAPARRAAGGGAAGQKHIWNAEELRGADLGHADHQRQVRLPAQAPARRDGQVEEVSVGSPFDYVQSTLLYTVNDIPEPGQRSAYERAMQNGLISLCKRDAGPRVGAVHFVRPVAPGGQRHSRAAGAGGVVVYDQASGASRHQLLEHFREKRKRRAIGHEELLGRRGCAGRVAVSAGDRQIAFRRADRSHRSGARRRRSRVRFTSTAYPRPCCASARGLAA